MNGKQSPKIKGKHRSGTEIEMSSSWIRDRWKVLAGSAVLLVAVVVGIAVSSSGGSGRADASDVQPVDEHFAVFREQLVPTGVSSLPAKSQQWLRAIQVSSAQAEQLAAGTDQARSSQPMVEERTSVSALTTVGPVGDGSTVAVAVVGQNVCAFDEGPGIGECANQNLALAGRAFSAVPVGCDNYRVLGLMPDGVSDLSVTTPSGTTGSVAVSSNIYEATLPAERTTLVSKDPPVEVELPLDQYAAMNDACN